jgi:hypothetical protein
MITEQSVRKSFLVDLFLPGTAMLAGGGIAFLFS